MVKLHSLVYLDNLSIDNVEYVEPLLWNDSDSANILAKGTSIW